MKTTLLVLLFATVLVPSALSQGGMTPPPGTPAPTFKTLQQVEPRVDLQGPSPAGVDTSNGAYHFIINQAGSYYLSANLAVTKTNGIQINAEGVTLDLNGFAISRGSGSGGIAIEILAAGDRALVHNGSVKGFHSGIFCTGSTDRARSCIFRNLRVSGCTNTGIHTGPGAVLESCSAHDNSGFVAIRTEDGSTLTNCTANNNTVNSAINAGGGSTLNNCATSNNTGITGISANTGSTLTNCTAFDNTVDSGITAGGGSSVNNCSALANTSASETSAGISTGPGCTVTNCVSRSNASTATSGPTTGMGFSLGSGSMIQKCVASGNEGNGITIADDSIALENTSEENGLAGGDGAGIHATGDDNRIEANNVVNNDRGIDVDMAGNLIVKNSASGNNTNYSIAAGNFFGPIVDVVVPAGSPTPAPVEGNEADGNLGTGNPWANIRY